MEETKSNNTTTIVVVGIILVVAVGVVMMMRSGTTETITETPEEMVVEASPEVDADVTSIPETTGIKEATVKTIEVEAGAFYYKPNVITVKKGDKIKIVMKSVDMMHDFNIDELDVKLEIIKSGNTGTVEFVADKVGTYEYYCSVGEHRAKGQVGKIIVQ